MKRATAAIIVFMLLLTAGAAWAADENDQPPPLFGVTASAAPRLPRPEPVFPDSMTANTDWRVYRDSLFTPQGAYFPMVNEDDYKGRPGDKGNWRDYYLADKPYVPGVGWPRRVPHIRRPPRYCGDDGFYCYSCPPPPRDRYYYYEVYYSPPPPPPPPVVIIINNNLW